MAHHAGDRIDTFPGDKEREDLPDLDSLVLIDLKPAVHIVIPRGGVSAAVEVTGFAAGDAAHGEALGDLVLFQLGEDGQNADHGPAEGRGCIEILIDGNEVGTVGQKLIFD